MVDASCDASRRLTKRRTPVWTAFITHQIASPKWMLRPRSNQKIVYLAELQRFVFTNEYNPQLSPEGDHELKFQSSACAFYALLWAHPLTDHTLGAAEFLDVIDELARHRT